MIEHSSDLPPKIRISIKTLQIYTKSFVGATNCNKKIKRRIGKTPSPPFQLTNSRRTTHGNNLKRIDTANIHTKYQTSKQKCKIFYKKWYLQTTQSIDKCKCLYVYICYYQKYMTEWRKIKPRRGVISKTCA